MIGHGPWALRDVPPPKMATPSRGVSPGMRDDDDRKIACLVIGRGGITRDVQIDHSASVSVIISAFIPISHISLSMPPEIRVAPRCRRRVYGPPMALTLSTSSSRCPRIDMPQSVLLP